MVDYINLKDMLPSIMQSLSNNGEVVFTVAGNSMRPLLTHGRDSVTLVKPAFLKKYDMVLFTRKDGSPVLHRIISENNCVYLIRGDNCYYDEFVKREDIIALVKCFVKSGKEKTTRSFSYKMYCFLRCNTVSFLFRKHIWIRIKSLLRKIFK